MSKFLDHPEFYDIPISLSAGQQNNPCAVASDLFVDLSIAEPPQFIPVLSETNLTGNAGSLVKADKRVKPIYFLRKLRVVILRLAILLLGDLRRNKVRVLERHSDDGR